MNTLYVFILIVYSWPLAVKVTWPNNIWETVQDKIKHKNNFPKSETNIQSGLNHGALCRTDKLLAIVQENIGHAVHDCSVPHLNNCLSEAPAVRAAVLNWIADFFKVKPRRPLCIDYLFCPRFPPCIRPSFSVLIFFVSYNGIYLFSSNANFPTCELKHPFREVCSHAFAKRISRIDINSA